MEYLLRYPLDLTGRNPDNLIRGESHVLKDMRFRAIAPYYGAFFGDTAVLYDEFNNRPLIRNKDFVTAEVLVDKTSLTGQPVNGIILIINRQVSKNVRIDYQCLGGDNFKNNQSIENLLKVEHDDYVSYSYTDINKKPESFKPTFHKHSVVEIYGFEYVTYLLESIRNAVIWKKLDLVKELIGRVDQEIVNMVETNINNSDEAFNKFLSDYRHAFRKEIFDLAFIKNYRPSTQQEGVALANGDRVNLTDEAYITIQTISFFKSELYSFLLAKSKTGLGTEYGLIGNPTKEYLASAPNGTRFFIDSHDVAVKTGQTFDLTVFPDLQAKRTKFTIYKISNHAAGRGGIFMATNLLTAATYIGKLAMYGENLLMEWKQLQLASISDQNFADVINHLGDTTNPHGDTKEDVGFDLLENLSVATKEDVLAQIAVRKYLTAENLQLYMKGFMAGQVDNNEIKPDPKINVMKRFDIVFSDCGDNLVNSDSRICSIDEIDFSFNVYTQRVKYRNAKRLAENPELKDFNPVIYEAFTKLVGSTLSTDHSTRTGVKLVNLPEVLSINQTWNFGTLYQGFRSGVYDYETTDPYYDTLLVVRGAKTKPSVNGALELRYIKSHDELLAEYGGVQGLADEFEFQMKKGDYLVCFRAFNKPPEGASEQAILDFEKKEQVTKIEIFSTGYTFHIDLRTAVFEDFNFITLKEKNSPKVIPSIHYPAPPENWFNNEIPQEAAGFLSTVIVGKARLGPNAVDIEPDEDLGINTLIENFRDNPSRPGYVNGTLGMTVVKLNNDGTTKVDYPMLVENMPRDDFYNGILGVSLENDKATAVFQEQLDLVKSVNYNIFLDPFLDVTKVTRPIPYDNLTFSNPYASGNNSVGATKFDAFIQHMRLGFNRANALDTVSERMNSSKGKLVVKVKNPQNHSEEFEVEIEEGLRLNRDLFNSLYVNYITNSSRKKYWGQPTTSLPYTELVEIPKKFVNQYKQEYRIIEGDGRRELEKANVSSPENIEIDIIEVGRLESEHILAGYEKVQYNALFNNVAILKNWRFKGVREVIDIDKYIAGERYPTYPDYNVDRSVSGTEKDVTIFGVLDLTFSKEAKYAEGMYGAKSFVATAVNDLQRREIVIKLDDDIYDQIAREIGESVAGDDQYQIAEDGFSTFNIMFGEYNSENHLKFDRETKKITIDMQHVGQDHQSIFFKHHLKYIKWNFKVELVPTIITSVLYPVMHQNLMKAKATLVSVKYNNFAKYIRSTDYMKTDFELLSATVRRVIGYLTYRTEDYMKTDFEFINARVRRVIGYRTTTMDDYAKADFEFLRVTHRKVVDYIVYRNHEPELMRSKFELVEVKVKTVRIP